MNLLTYLLKQTQCCQFVFPQERSLQRAIALAFGILCGVGRRTLTRAIAFHGNTQKDWSADYKVFSRSPWEPRALFHPILEQAIQEHQLQRIVISTDDTRVWRNGKHVPETQWHRDWEAQNVSLVVRCRKDIVLCRRAPGKGRRFYGRTPFTPEQVRRRSSRARWQIARIFHGGAYREVRYKELTKVYWQGGARKREVRLLVVAPVGYRTSKNGRKYYRQPAYLLTTDLTTSAVELLQAYFDRWGIEVNHRDEKDILGVGQAQVWNKNSVRKVPALLVAMYSWLQLAGLKCYGPTRTDVDEPLPKWRRGAKRPSCLDLVTLLRKQLTDHPVLFATAKTPPTYPMMVGSAAA